MGDWLGPGLVVVVLLFGCMGASDCSDGGGTTGAAANDTFQISPAEVTLAPGASTAFRISENNPMVIEKPGDIVWNPVTLPDMAFDPNGGTIDASGGYSAPNVTGDYHVEATRVSTQTHATATIHVTRTSGNHLIAFTSNLSELPGGSVTAFPSVYTLDAANSFANLTHASSTNAPDAQARFSPDGRTIVFSRSGATGSGNAIQRMNVDGSSVVQIDPIGLPAAQAGRLNNWPSLSPDGSTILFTNGTETARIAVMNLNGSSAHFIYTPPANEDVSAPSYSPDGQHILFSKKHQDVANIFEMNANGSNLRSVTSLPIGGVDSAVHPRYNVNALLIVYELVHSSGAGVPSHDIHTINPSGTNDRAITTDGKSMFPCFTSTGNILFVSSISGKQEIYSVDQNGGSLANLTMANKTGATFADPDSL